MGSISKSNDNVEIIVSTYWPTQIVKDVSIRRLDKDSHFHNDITLDKKDALYLYEQLHHLFDPEGKMMKAQAAPAVILKGVKPNDK